MAASVKGFRTLLQEILLPLAEKPEWLGRHGKAPIGPMLPWQASDEGRFNPLVRLGHLFWDAETSPEIVRLREKFAVLAKHGMLPRQPDNPGLFSKQAREDLLAAQLLKGLSEGGGRVGTPEPTMVAAMGPRGESEFVELPKAALLAVRDRWLSKDFQRQTESGKVREGPGLVPAFTAKGSKDPYHLQFAPDEMGKAYGSTVLQYFQEALEKALRRVGTRWNVSDPRLLRDALDSDLRQGPKALRAPRGRPGPENPKPLVPVTKGMRDDMELRRLAAEKLMQDEEYKGLLGQARRNESNPKAVRQRLWRVSEHNPDAFLAESHPARDQRTGPVPQPGPMAEAEAERMYRLAGPGFRESAPSRDTAREMEVSHDEAAGRERFPGLPKGEFSDAKETDEGGDPVQERITGTSPAQRGLYDQLIKALPERLRQAFESNPKLLEERLKQLGGLPEGSHQVRSAKQMGRLIDRLQTMNRGAFSRMGARVNNLQALGGGEEANPATQSVRESRGLREQMRVEDRPGNPAYARELSRLDERANDPGDVALGYEQVVEESNATPLTSGGSRVRGSQRAQGPLAGMATTNFMDPDSPHTARAVFEAAREMAREKGLDPMVAIQLMRRVPREVKNRFLMEDGELKYRMREYSRRDVEAAMGGGEGSERRLAWEKLFHRLSR